MCEWHDMKFLERSFHEIFFIQLREWFCKYTFNDFGNEEA